MCGRYVNLTDFVFRSIYGFDRVVPLPPFEPLFNIAPRSFAPIVRVSSSGEIEQVLARWGLVPASFPTLEHANQYGCPDFYRRDCGLCIQFGWNFKRGNAIHFLRNMCHHFYPRPFRKLD